MKKTLLLAVFFLTAMSSSALASGFAIIEQSVSGLGNAFAGGAASSEDASMMYFNPAIMTEIKGQQVVGGFHVIVPSAEVGVSSAVTLGGPLVQGTNNIDGGQTGVAPNLYYLNNPGNGFGFGLGINAPFGLATKYDKNWLGRYHAVESDVKTININPSVAYKVNDQLSLGAGINLMYMEATLSSMVNGGLAAFSASGGTVGTPNDPSDDIFVENEADDWGYGFNLGILYKLSDSTQIGLAYRSEVKQELEGSTKTDVPSTLSILGSAFAGAFGDQGVNGDIDLPATASLSFNQKVGGKLTLMADVLWTDWSSFEKLTLNFEGAGIGGNPSTTTVENWNDSWRYSAGATYQYSDALKLRCGVAFDETPIPDAAHRTPRIPGEDRFWVAVGAGYQPTKRFNIDIAYAHLFVDDSKIDLSLAANPSAGSLTATSENAVDIASVQLSYNF